MGGGDERRVMRGGDERTGWEVGMRGGDERRVMRGGDERRG